MGNKDPAARFPRKQKKKGKMLKIFRFQLEIDHRKDWQVLCDLRMDSPAMGALLRDWGFLGMGTDQEFGVFLGMGIVQGFRGSREQLKDSGVPGNGNSSGIRGFLEWE